MKRIALFFLIALPAVAQSKLTSAELKQRIEGMCRGSTMAYIASKEDPPRVKDGNGELWNNGRGLDVYDAFVRSTERLVPIFKRTYPTEGLIIVMSTDNEINAWAFGSWLPHNHLVCVPENFVKFMGNEDELAFMIGHEIGHTRDPNALCGTAEAYAKLNREQKVACESRADEIGYWFLRQADYSPFAAAGAFGRVEMYSGDIQTGILGMFRQLNSDHPTNPKRIENFRRMLAEESRAAR